MKKKEHSPAEYGMTPEVLQTFCEVMEIVEGGGEVAIKKKNGVITAYEVSMKRIKE